MYGTKIMCDRRLLSKLVFLRDMKKDYYRAFPSTSLLLEIRELISAIRALKNKLKL